MLLRVTVKTETIYLVSSHRFVIKLIKCTTADVVFGNKDTNFIVIYIVDFATTVSNMPPDVYCILLTSTIIYLY